jgi:hypothetical protein
MNSLFITKAKRCKNQVRIRTFYFTVASLTLVPANRYLTRAAPKFHCFTSYHELHQHSEYFLNT